ncbi:MAG: hypothetical protein JST75_20930 [Bacteroidetes bacterium]|nr:hypothetical protein [Bacteroidota bacterium]
MREHFKAALFAIVIFLAGCTTYHLTTESLLQQFADVTPETKKNFIVAFPLIFPGIVTGNSLTEIKVLDQNNKEHTLPVTNHTGVRITKKDGTRKTFYFDTLLIQDSTINGKKSHFVGIDIKPIKLDEIEKIELQR